MRTEEYISELEDYFVEAIEKKDRKTIRRFIISVIESHDRNLHDVSHSIELLANQMSSFQREMNTRFEETNARFESIQREMNTRFEAVDKRFEIMDKRLDSLDRRLFQFMIWSFSFTATCSGIIIAVLKLT